MSYLIGLDTETTGLKVEDGDRIIEFCGQVYRWADRKKVIDITQRFSNEGRKIHAKAQEVHGISQMDLIGKPRFRDFAPKIDAILKKAPVIVAHNAAFDVGFLVHHMEEAGLPLPGHLFVFDTMGEGMTASYDSKPPSLQEFCWAMGVEYDSAQAHAAKYDTDIMIQAFFAGIDYGYIDAPEILTIKEVA